MISGKWVLASALSKLRPLKRWVELQLLREFGVHERFATPKAHETMLLDRARCEAYRDALERMVHPGDIVVDLGAGTGLLSLLAIQAGARHVYAIEMTRIADLALQVIEANHFQDRITLVRGYSKNVRLPEPCDLLVTETLSDCGFDSENMIDYVADARRRMLKPSGRVIPESTDTLFMPIQSEGFGLGRLPPRLYDLDFAHFRRECYSHPGLLNASGKNMVELAEPVRGWHVDLLHETTVPGAATFDFLVLREGRLDGFLGWFEAILCPGVSLSNSPRAPQTSWAQLYLPVLDQPRVRRGQRLRLEIDPQVAADVRTWKYQISITLSDSLLAVSPETSEPSPVGEARGGS